MTERWIHLDGVVNMRDLGGLPTRDGGAVAHGRLIRSDNLQDLSDADVERIVELGVSDIIDLRSETELHTEGPGPLWHRESLRHHHHSLVGLPGQRVTALDALVIADGSESSTRDAAFWTKHYLGYLMNRPDSVSAALDIVAGASGAAVVHCAAGKYRTGTVIAMALDVAGVPHEEIIADYTLTEQRLQQIIERLMSSELYRGALLTQQPGEQVPRAETMETILSTVESEFGGAAGWLRAHGWSAEAVDRLRRRLTF